MNNIFSSLDGTRAKSFDRNLCAGESGGHTGDLPRGFSLLQWLLTVVVKFIFVLEKQVLSSFPHLDVISSVSKERINIGIGIGIGYAEDMRGRGEEAHGTLLSRSGTGTLLCGHG